MNNISPYVRVALDITNNTNTTLPKRVIFDYEILYIKEGKLDVWIENNNFIAQKGDIIIFRPKVEHSFTVLEQLRQPHIHFDMFYKEDSPKILVNFSNLDEIPQEQMHFFEEDILKNFHVNMPDHIKLINPSYFESMLFEIINEFSKKLPLYEIILKGLTINLLVYLTREIQSGEAIVNNTNYEQLLKVKHYIDANFTENITLDFLSQYANISKFYLNKLFSLSFGSPPLKYFHNVRSMKAQELLRYTNNSITSISDYLGFNEICIFTRSFKLSEGISPRDFRKKYRL